MGVILQFISAPSAPNRRMGVFLSQSRKDWSQAWSQETPISIPSCVGPTVAPNYLLSYEMPLRTLRHRHPHNVHILSFSLLAEASGRIQKHESQCFMKKKERKKGNHSLKQNTET